jgi:hypothetical protein
MSLRAGQAGARRLPGQHRSSSSVMTCAFTGGRALAVRAQAWVLPMLGVLPRARAQPWPWRVWSAAC